MIDSALETGIYSLLSIVYQKSYIDILRNDSMSHNLLLTQSEEQYFMHYFCMLVIDPPVDRYIFSLNDATKSAI